MDARSREKVEIRSRTGSPYNRAGQRWSSAWTEASPDLLNDDGKMKLLSEDPHIEIRVDGVFVTGPRKGQRLSKAADEGGEAAATASSDEGELAALRQRNEELEKRLEEMQTAHERERADVEKRHEGALSDLRNQLAARGTAASATPPAPTVPQGKADDGGAKPKK